MRLWSAELVLKTNILVLAESAPAAKEIALREAFDALLEESPLVQTLWATDPDKLCPSWSPNDLVHDALDSGLLLKEAKELVREAAEAALVAAHNAEVLKNQLPLFPTLDPNSSD